MLSVNEIKVAATMLDRLSKSLRYRADLLTNNRVYGVHVGGPDVFMLIEQLRAVMADIDKCLPEDITSDHRR